MLMLLPIRFTMAIAVFNELSHNLMSCYFVNRVVWKRARIARENSREKLKFRVSQVRREEQFSSLLFLAPFAFTSAIHR